MESAMAEKELEAPESVEPKKKRSKLPVLIALVAILSGGGFFAMKMKKGAAGPEKIELGEIVKLEEILVNLKDPNTYARTDISLHLQKNFEKKPLEDKIDAVRDAIILKLSSKSLGEVRTLDGKVELKKELAEAINAVLAKGGDEKAKHAAAKGAPNPDWDSASGPVLKIYFSNFATQ
jgi:flagellar FliL protein